MWEVPCVHAFDEASEGELVALNRALWPRPPEQGHVQHTTYSMHVPLVRSKAKRCPRPVMSQMRGMRALDTSKRCAVLQHVVLGMALTSGDADDWWRRRRGRVPAQMLTGPSADVGESRWCAGVSFDAARRGRQATDTRLETSHAAHAGSVPMSNRNFEPVVSRRVPVTPWHNVAVDSRVRMARL
jgi:hypothetical protein